MARIFITGSSDGLGSLAARALIKKGHKVVLHARNAQRAQDALSACPGAENVLIGDLSSLDATKTLASKVNALGPFDTIIHNAGLYRGGYMKTADGLPSLLVVNTISPYVLTCLVDRPKRLVFVSSGLHVGGDGGLGDFAWRDRGEKGWSDGQAYADTKLHNILLAKVVARRWVDVCSTALDPGWVATKMGGANATGDIDAAVQTYVMLAEGDEKVVSGKYYTPGRKEGSPKEVCSDEAVQDKLLELCEEVSGVEFPS